MVHVGGCRTVGTWLCGAAIRQCDDATVTLAVIEVIVQGRRQKRGSARRIPRELSKFLTEATASLQIRGTSVGR